MSGWDLLVVLQGAGNRVEMAQNVAELKIGTLLARAGDGISGHVLLSVSRPASTRLGIQSEFRLNAI
jgi:hypothetical protein